MPAIGRAAFIASLTAITGAPFVGAGLTLGWLKIIALFGTFRHRRLTGTDPPCLAVTGYINHHQPGMFPAPPHLHRHKPVGAGRLCALVAAISIAGDAHSTHHRPVQRFSLPAQDPPSPQRVLRLLLRRAFFQAGCACSFFQRGQFSAQIKHHRRIDIQLHRIKN